MKTKHTPGPWKIEYEVHAQGPVHCIRTEEGALVGKVSTWHYTRDNGEAIAEAKANARLIAAAPELMEAVQAFQEWLHAETKDFQSVSFDKRMELCDVAQMKADAAIAKATGETI